ncbi:unnamed protein product [Commensalibacter communis]|uniref:Cyanophage baseplate Pam3 plug gp18 domain-containing protein n=1 Tax=Commensalibacter communis TaxID=2972786 RepID=A0A9W4XAK4_9PROT|nr:hypothetical protein [Commensalibacter communis]CAI3955078.1 unnamed protein product [Commensalibacter communis]CAI3955836.1 unnamed protein product [Commensalibacter communis]CAI3956673.1 unnamed protein product [Commensalibacter communis]CAI3958077.1 unnamed protein product [Commensalibacter communis]CAI3958421.1 unnamed protein product [Commensalibacter communis]
MKIISLNAIDAQEFSSNFDGTMYSFRLMDKGNAGVFMDIYDGVDPVLTGILCLDRVRLVRSAYVNFPGDLMFVDQEGFTHPTYTGFGSRYLLYYLAEGDDDGIGM